MTPQQVLIDGKLSPLGKRIGKGGEGEIFLHPGNRSQAIKLYTVADLAERALKVRAVVSAKLADQASQVAFPLSEVRALSGEFLGFAMRLVEGCQPLHELYAPGSRKINFGFADYRFLVRTAGNIARAIASVHQSGCVIGDVNHSGILVSPKAMVTLIDADSFQVTTREGQFLCKVGVPEYTPPELQGKSLAGVLRTPNHDAFGLAVVIFQLLFMGRHPFVGTVRTGDIPPLHENILNFRYAYTDRRNVGMDQPPGTPSIQDFSAPLAVAFDKAFSAEGAATRPSAQAWVATLDALEQSLVKCDVNELHFIPREASECAWCEMDRLLGTHLFVPYIPAASLIAGVDPGQNDFDLTGIWARILQVKATTDVQLSPKLPAADAGPSDAAKRAKAAAGSRTLPGVAMILAALVGLFAAPKAIFIWLVLFVAGVVVAKSKRPLDASPFRTGYIASEQLLARELLNWNRRNGTEDFQKLFGELQANKEEYDGVLRDESQEVRRHTEQRRAAQLSSYLDSFSLAKASIRSLSAATRAVLNSYGVDTANDVVDGRIQHVPGVGAATSRKLLDWRQKLEGQFVFRADSSAADRAAALQARFRSETRAAPLRARLAAGPQNLTQLAARMRQIASNEDALLARAKRARDQSRRDLEFLEIPVPTISTPATPAPAKPVAATQARQWQTQAWTPRNSVSTASPHPVTAKMTCPRCGQGMVKRLARRGRNAGGYFWGCSRYPSCKGTRDI